MDQPFPPFYRFQNYPISIMIELFVFQHLIKDQRPSRTNFVVLHHTFRSGSPLTNPRSGCIIIHNFTCRQRDGASVSSPRPQSGASFGYCPKAVTGPVDAAGTHREGAAGESPWERRTSNITQEPRRRTPDPFRSVGPAGRPPLTGHRVRGQDGHETSPSAKLGGTTERTRPRPFSDERTGPFFIPRDRIPTVPCRRRPMTL